MILFCQADQNKTSFEKCFHQNAVIQLPQTVETCSYNYSYRSSVQMSIVTQKSVFVYGEPITVEINFSNVSNEVIHIPRFKTHWDDEIYRIRVFRTDNSERNSEKKYYEVGTTSYGEYIFSCQP
jgi:hypothetical protein